MLKLGFAGTLRCILIETIYCPRGQAGHLTQFFSDDDSTPGMLYHCVLHALETTGHAHSVLESELVPLPSPVLVVLGIFIELVR